MPVQKKYIFIFIYILQVLFLPLFIQSFLFLSFYWYHLFYFHPEFHYTGQSYLKISFLCMEWIGGCFSLLKMYHIIPILFYVVLFNIACVCFSFFFLFFSSSQGYKADQFILYKLIVSFKWKVNYLAGILLSYILQVYTLSGCAIWFEKIYRLCSVVFYILGLKAYDFCSELNFHFLFVYQEASFFQNWRTFFCYTNLSPSN